MSERFSIQPNPDRGVELVSHRAIEGVGVAALIILINVVGWRIIYLAVAGVLDAVTQS